MGFVWGKGVAARLRPLGFGLLGEFVLALRERSVRLVSVAFFTGQVCDTLTTHVALASGRFAEANPFFAPALSADHQGLAMALKLLLSLTVLVLAVTRLAEPRRRAVLLVLAFISLEAPATNGLRILGVL